MPAPPTPRPALPGLRLPLGQRRLGRGAAISLLVHALILAVLIVHSREVLQRLPGAPGHGGGGGNRPQVNFFTLPTTGPTAVLVPAAPALALSDVRSLPQLKLDLPPLEVPRETLRVALLGGGAAGASGAGPGAGGGQGGGTGADAGPGTGGEGGYIFVASPRTAILPPLAKVPGSVAGRTYVVKFWVAVDGRVTRVEIDPPIADAAYSREFQQRMMAYQFYPARTRDGR
ncbi:MAG TPA: hypothetical protein VEK85_16690, partial [Gemmatimonadales bacterium]|nr:hypothetical protein [Gemmatimonadales bacterium]